MTQSYASDDGEDDDAADELTNVKALNKSRVTTTPWTNFNPTLVMMMTIRK